MAKKASKKKSPPLEDLDDDDEAIGWDAINDALAPIYGRTEPDFHYGTVIPWGLGGRDPLQGISVYRRADPVPHWHYVSYGLTELYEKESDNPDVNGFGFELTFRLRRGKEKTPPPWAMNLMQNLARYVFDSGNAFRAQHTLFCNGPIKQGDKTDLRALLFLKDPELPVYHCDHGEAIFLEIVGITEDEHRQIQLWNASAFTKILLDALPLGVTDLKRKSVLETPDVRKRIDKGTKKDGSGCERLFVGEESFEAKGKKLRLVFGALAAGSVRSVMPARLDFDRPLTIQSPTNVIIFKPGTGLSWKKLSKTELEVTAGPAERIALLETFEPKAGTRIVARHPNVTVEVRKSLIRDEHGNVVDEVG